MTEDEQEMDARTLDVKGMLWRCPQCGTRWVGDMVPIWRHEGRCLRCQMMPGWLYDPD